MMPILHLPGEMTPGQLDPISRVRPPFKKAQTFTMSSAGMPSVIATTSGRPAAAASMIASAANAGGTKITDAFAPVSRTACSTVSKTGRSRGVEPPRPGVTPPIPRLPYAIACCASNVPSFPVNPCTIRRVLSSTSTLIVSSIAQPVVRLLCRQADYLFRRIAHPVRNREVEPGLLQNPEAQLHVGAFHADHNRRPNLQIARGRHHTGGQRVAA